jgi:hypothetical protein
MAPSVMALINCCEKYAMPLPSPSPATYHGSSGPRLQRDLHANVPAFRGGLKWTISK